MKYTLCCTDCGNRMTTALEGMGGEITCEHCGAVMNYRVQDNTSVVRIEKHSPLMLPHRIRTLKVFCPVCGHRIAKSADGTYTETVCPKCRTEFAYDIQAETLYTQLIQPSGKEPAHNNPEKAVRVLNQA